MIIAEPSDVLTAPAWSSVPSARGPTRRAVVGLGSGDVPKWRREANGIADTPAVLKDLFARSDRRGR
ncbi:hypothetical protein OIU91_23085 [Streptomyces sp. NBC_01456]